MIDRRERGTPSRRRFRAGLPLLLVLALVGAACGSDDDDDASSDDDAAASSTTEGPATTTAESDAWAAIVEAANAEGKVVFYSPVVEPILQSIEAAFEEEYPEIDAEIVRVGGGDLIARIDQERATDADGADVFAVTTGAFLKKLHDEGDLVPFESPTHAELLDTIYKEYPGLSIDNDRAVHMAEAYWIVWNTDLVDTPIEDYDDLLARADEFKGQIGAPDLFAEVVTHFYTTIEEGIDGVDLAADVQAGTWLESFAELEPKFYASAVPLTEAVAAGEVKAGIFSIAPTWGGLQDKGAPIEATLSSLAPTSANLFAGIAQWSRHPNAAQVFLDFLLTEKGQRATAKFRSLALRPDIPGSSGDASSMLVVRDDILEKAYVDGYVEYWKSVMGL